MSELERAPQQSIVRPVPVPSVLAEFGIRVGQDELSGMRVVVIPPEVRQNLNVIDPVSSFAQADPNWTPRISVVALDPAKSGDHFYEQANKKLAPTKQALEVLAKAAGILYTRTSRIPRAELAEGERLGYKATLGIRRSDGTVEEVTRDKTFVEDAELEEIKDAVARATAWENGRNTGRPRFTSDAERAEETRKRWLKELKDAPAKTESKAVLRAIRAALQIPHTFSPADAAKPFLVIGFNFTPDYNDEETKRLLVAAGLNAQAAMYGGGGAVHSRDVELEPPQHAAASDGPDDARTTPVGAGHSGDEGRQAGDAIQSSPSPASPVPDPGEEDDPEPGREPPHGDQAKQDADAAGLVKVPDSAAKKYAGKQIAQVHGLGPEGVEWISWALKPGRQWNRTGHVFSQALVAYCKHYLPDLLPAESEAA